MSELRMPERGFNHATERAVVERAELLADESWSDLDWRAAEWVAADCEGKDDLTAVVKAALKAQSLDIDLGRACAQLRERYLLEMEVMFRQQAQYELFDDERDEP